MAEQCQYNVTNDGVTAQTSLERPKSQISNVGQEENDQRIL